MTAGLVEPRKVFEIAFSTDPQSPTPNYVEVTPWVLDSACDVEYGRQHELGEVEPGRCTFELLNSDRRFDPTNTAGPYYPIYPYRRFRFSAEWPWLPGDAFNGDFAALPGTTGWTAAANTTIAGTVAQLFSQVPNALSLTATGTGNIGVSQTLANVPAATPGVVYTAHARLRPASTARTVRIDIVWLNAAKAVISTSTGTGVLQVAGQWARPTITATAPALTAYRQVVVTVVSAGAAEVHYLAAVVTAPGIDVGVVPQFTGFIDEFPTEWPTALKATTKAKALDGLDLLNRKKLTSLLYQQAMVALGPSSYWRLGDPPTSRTVRDISGNNHDGTIAGTVILGAPGGLITDVDNAIDVGAYAGWIEIPAGAAPTGTNAFSISMLVFIRAVPVAGLDAFFRIGGVADTSFANGSINTGGQLSLRMGDGVNGGGRETPLGYADSAWHHVVLVRPAGSLAATWHVYVDGADVGVATFSFGAAPVLQSGLRMYIASVGDGAGGMNGIVDEVGVFSSALSAAQVQTLYNAYAGPGVSQTTGTRIATLADAAGWSAADRAIDTGRTILPPITTSLTDTFAVAAMKDVEQAEAGLLFVDPANLLTFYARDRLMKTPFSISQGTFVDSAPTGAEMPYQRGGLATAYDTTDIYNEVVVTPTVGGGSQVASDATSQGRYGGVPRTLPISTLVTAPSENWDRANFELNRHKDAQVRVKSLRIRPFSDPTNMFPQVLQRRLWDRITAVRKNPPGGGPAFSQDGVIEGVKHTVRPGLWETTWATSPAETQPYFVWGISKWGQDTRWAY